MNKTLKAIVVMIMMAWWPMQATAGDYEVANVMDDSLYGAGVGGMVGLGLMLLSDSPTSNWNYVSRGVGVGIIAGAAYGLFRSSQAFAEVEDGVIHLGIPSPEFAVRSTSKGLDLMLKTDLIRGTF